MPRFRSAYPPEFRRQLVELVRSGRTPEELSRGFEPTAPSISTWVKQAERDAGKRTDGPATAERESRAVRGVRCHVERGTRPVARCDGDLLALRQVPAEDVERRVQCSLKSHRPRLPPNAQPSCVARLLAGPRERRTARHHVIPRRSCSRLATASTLACTCECRGHAGDANHS